MGTPQIHTSTFFTMRQHTPLRTAIAVCTTLAAAAANPNALAATSEVCTPTPSGPARAAAERAVAVDRERGYGLAELADGVYMASDGNFSMGVVVTDEGVVLIDAPTSMGAVIEPMVASITELPITHVIYSHGHADHIGGAAEIDGNFRTLASAGAAEELARFNRAVRTYPFGSFVGGTGAVPSPDTLVDGTFTLRTGGRTLQLDTLQTGHSDADLVAYLPEAKTLVAVDVTWPASVPWVRLGDADNVPGYIEQNRTLLEYDFEHLIAGHFAIVGNRQDVERTIEYLEDLRTEGVAALREVNVATVAQETGHTDTYMLMDAYFQATVDRAAAPVIERWRDELQGAGVWTCQHAQWTISSLRYDQAAER